MEPPYATIPDSNFPPGNGSRNYTELEVAYFQDDGIWLLSCSFAIWTMVSGFGLLESGRVSSKDEVNIMVKNVIDVVFGGLSYWAFGFGFTFGDLYPNPVIGIGKFFYDPDPLAVGVAHVDQNHQAYRYAVFFFQMSFATTTSTIVSASMAERIRLKPYIVITFLMTILHSIAAHWVWSRDGFLYRLGVVDAAGCSVVHLVGGVAGLAATLYLKPRQSRFGDSGRQTMSNPTNALLGTFMLWWGWLAFNTGTTYGVSLVRWRIASRSAVVTVMSSIGGGCTSILISLFATKKCQVDMLIDGLLASLVATTAICHCIRPFEAVIVGVVGSALALATFPLIERLEIDDPVGVIPVHVVGATWGMLSVGLFAREDPLLPELTKRRSGLFYSGELELLAVQALTVVVVFIWALVLTFLALATMDQLPWGLRMTKYEEQLGADLVEHGLAGHNVAKYSVEKKMNVKSISSVIKAMVKWKRIVRRAREERAELESRLKEQGLDPAHLPLNRGLAALQWRAAASNARRSTFQSRCGSLDLSTAVSQLRHTGRVEREKPSLPVTSNEKMIISMSPNHILDAGNIKSPSSTDIADNINHGGTKADIVVKEPPSPYNEGGSGGSLNGALPNGIPPLSTAPNSLSVGPPLHSKQHSPSVSVQMPPPERDDQLGDGHNQSSRPSLPLLVEAPPSLPTKGPLQQPQTSHLEPPMRGLRLLAHPSTVLSRVRRQGRVEPTPTPATTWPSKGVSESDDNAKGGGDELRSVIVIPPTPSAKTPQPAAIGSRPATSSRGVATSSSLIPVRSPSSREGPAGPKGGKDSRGSSSNGSDDGIDLSTGQNQKRD